MGEVLDIRANQPHMTGEARCLHCDHKWVAVSEVGVSFLDCPKCELRKGVYFALVSPQKDMWHCNCGNFVYTITPTHAYCTKCGLAQSFGG